MVFTRIQPKKNYDDRLSVGYDDLESTQTHKRAKVLISNGKRIKILVRLFRGKVTLTELRVLKQFERFDWQQKQTQKLNFHFLQITTFLLLTYTSRNQRLLKLLCKFCKNLLFAIVFKTSVSRVMCATV